MSNMTSLPMDLPPLPSYTLHPATHLLPLIPDQYLSLVLPILAYWIFSMVFHYIDTYDLFPQYRLHTPTEVLKRNHVSRWEVVRDVVIQQIVQTVMGVMFTMMEPEHFGGMDEYNVAVWAQRIRLGQRWLPKVLAVAGLNVQVLAQKALSSSPIVAGALAGGSYPWLISMTEKGPVPTFAAWELLAAKAIYWVLIPALQFGSAIIIVDTWQYFLHRAMHMNKWLYTTFHSRHHRLYVPYAYGALYNHPFEGFLLDTCGTGLAYLVSGLSPRQAMCLFTGATIKTVDDHCGYALPWDPLQHITSNNAGYHDVHHQSWGIKTNFSQPFFTFWDRLLGTVWTGGDVSARYERARLAAERRAQQDGSKPSHYTSSITASKPLDSILESTAPYEDEADNATYLTQSVQSAVQPAIPAGKATAQAIGSREQVLQDPEGGGASIIAEEAAEEEREMKKLLRRSPRKKVPASGTSAQAGSLKGLRERVAGGAGTAGFHSRTGGVLGYESSR